MTHPKRTILAHVGAAMLGATALAQTNGTAPAPAQPGLAQPAGQTESKPIVLPAGPAWSSPEIARVGDMLKGTWKTTAEVAGRDGASGAEVVMSISPIVTHDIRDAMYVETCRADAMHAPFRRTVFQLYTRQGKVRLRTFEPSTSEAREALDQLTGFWKYPEALPLLSSTTIKRSGFIATLDVELAPLKAGEGFAGKTPYPYPTGVNGAVEMTSEITLMPDAMTTVDRAVDADGKLVMGNDEKYTFTRYNSPVPALEKRDDGLVLLWYSKVVDGTTLDEKLRYYAHYTAWVAGGAQLDTSRVRVKPGGPFGLIQIPQVAVATIKAWKEALRGVGVGSNVRMLVPSELGYGVKGMTREGKQAVPPEAPLVFEIEMVGLEPAVKPEPQPMPDNVKIRPNGAGPQQAPR